MKIEIKHETFEGNKICDADCMLREDGEWRGRCHMFPDVERLADWDYTLIPHPDCHPGVYELAPEEEMKYFRAAIWSDDSTEAEKGEMEPEDAARFVSGLRAEVARLRKALEVKP